MVNGGAVALKGEREITSEAMKPRKGRVAKVREGEILPLRTFLLSWLLNSIHSAAGSGKQRAESEELISDF
jgi:hypothetical protein